MNFSVVQEWFGGATVEVRPAWMLGHGECCVQQCSTRFAIPNSKFDRVVVRFGQLFGYEFGSAQLCRDCCSQR